MLVVGVDGCPGGWVAVAYDDAAPSIAPAVFGSFAALLAAFPDGLFVGIDIPIGLAEGEPRRCDVEARRMLGARRASVFPAPDRRVVAVAAYADASARSRTLTGRGVSRQAFAIYPKVLEVDRAMSPALQQRVVEVHPEVSFAALAGHPMQHAKKTADGFAERRRLLTDALGVEIPDRPAARAWARPAGADDVLDAIVAAWSARRFALGRAGRLPAEPATDSHGLRMEIVH